MKKKIMTLLLMSAVLGLSYQLIYEPDQVTTDNAYVRGNVTNISPEVSGRVTKILVKDNQWVEKGTPLFVINQEDYLAKQAVAKAEFNAARIALKLNTVQIEMQKVKIDQAKQSIVTEEANKNYQSATVDRYLSLVKGNSISKDKYEDQKVIAIQARAKIKTAQLALSVEKIQYNSLLVTQKQFEAQLAKAQANLALADIALKNTTIVAASDGFIANRQVQVGKYVQAGMGSLTLIPNTVWIDANFKETQLEHVQPGQPVDVVLDMFPNRTLYANVESITMATGAQFSLLPPQNATGNFVKVVQRVPVRLNLEIPEDLKNRIYPGLSAVVSIHTNITQKSLRLTEK